MNNYDAGASTILFNNAGNQLMRLTFAAPSVPEAQGSGASSDSNLSSSNRFVNDDLGESRQEVVYDMHVEYAFDGSTMHRTCRATKVLPGHGAQLLWHPAPRFV